MGHEGAAAIVSRGLLEEFWLKKRLAISFHRCMYSSLLSSLLHVILLYEECDWLLSPVILK